MSIATRTNDELHVYIGIQSVGLRFDDGGGLWAEVYLRIQPNRQALVPSYGDPSPWSVDFRAQYRVDPSCQLCRIVERAVEAGKKFTMEGELPSDFQFSTCSSLSDQKTVSRAFKQAKTVKWRVQWRSNNRVYADIPGATDGLHEKEWSWCQSARA